ncbi:hypothetical protein CIL03_02005 [Virgibacillus indicus]|uniref:Uncharacterized protein n=1 Tax=Virgibacillus indicus TaxID=2024554 RepID=A0A265NDQ0_9BACI|nr:hypothetical protein CIL03_02005 [Virgibacillus indicus]
MPAESIRPQRSRTAIIADTNYVAIYIKCVISKAIEFTVANKAKLLRIKQNGIKFLKLLSIT